MEATAQKINPELKGGISLVLPCHNEAGNIQDVIIEAIAALEKVTGDFEIIVVDDGSTDGTREKAARLSAYKYRLKIKTHSKNLGYGAALRTGFAAADKAWIFFTDADRQFQISEITKLIPYLEQSKMVIGFRARRQDPLHRRIYGAVFSFLIRVLFRVSARDVNCAFKIFNRKIIADEKLVSRGALINAELLALARRKGIVWVEVPVSHFPRRAGKQTGGSFRVIARAPWELVRLFFHRL